MTKYAMAPEAEDIGSHYVDQNFLFQFSSQNIDKIKWAAPYVLSNLVLTHILDMILIVSESSILLFFGKIFG